VEGISHETLSLMMLKRMNETMNSALEGAIQIHNNLHPKKYLHQLVSSQLDVDRMDYLNRDSFYTGVSEGVISYDRILQMLTVNNEELMVEEKGVHSVEKFIIARRLMYWQVYLHKAVLGAEMLLVNILKRAKELASSGYELFATPSLHYFLYNQLTQKDFDNNPDNLLHFCELDDNDVLSSIKVWMKDKDEVLSRLCKMMLERRLYKTLLSGNSLEEILEEKRKALKNKFGWDDTTLNYFAFTGTTSTSTYNTDDEKITIALKNGKHCDISEIENPLVNQTLAKPVHKNYICYLQP
jgi:HD superfamily phosphohydrolase